MTTPKEALRSLEYMLKKRERERDEYEVMPEDSPRKATLAKSHAYNLEHIPALRFACVLAGAEVRQASGEPQASELLCQLVAALRAGHAARGIVAKVEAEALLEEAFGKAATFCDDWSPR